MFSLKYPSRLIARPLGPRQVPITQSRCQGLERSALAVQATELGGKSGGCRGHEIRKESLQKNAALQLASTNLAVNARRNARCATLQPRSTGPDGCRSALRTVAAPRLPDDPIHTGKRIQPPPASPQRSESLPLRRPARMAAGRRGI